MKYSLLSLSACLLASVGIVGCGDEPEGKGAATGGLKNTGGTITGGTTSGGKTAGGNTATGGAVASGGKVTTGGVTTNTGGSTTPPAGGAKSGGTSAGGSTTPSSGGAANGGSTTGGVVATGGSTTSTGGTTPIGGSTGSSDGFKPRVIATTDGEVDDRSSMVRFLMYSSDYEVVGISQNNSIFQKSGHSKDGWVEKVIGLYGQVYPNLKKHHPGYPEPAALAAVNVVGNENSGDLQTAPPNMATKDTAGSTLMIKTLLDKDPRPVHIPSWGGANTTAYALWKLKTAHTPEEYKYGASRIWLYGICYNLTTKAQDGGFQWIIDNIPDAKIYPATSWAKTWQYDSYDGARAAKSDNPPDVQEYMKPAWLTENVKSGHGPLGAYTPQNYTSEGDTPSFLSLIDTGLDSHMDYRLGGWGGRAVVKSGNWFEDALDEAGPSPKHSALYRWTIAAQKDYAARMDWGMAADYTGANHHPIVKVTGGNKKSVAGGATVTLDAAESSDPDGNGLSFKWWQYHEADSASAKVTIANATAKTGASFTAPSEPGKEVHIILEVTDDGKPPMTRYQRVYVSIK